MHPLKLEYDKLAPIIDQKYITFKTIYELGNNEIFPELLFCTCTPQSNAERGWKAVQDLYKFDYIKPFNDKSKQQLNIENTLAQAGVRFKKNKAKYIMQNLEKFDYGNLIKQYIENLINLYGNIIQVRNFIAKDITGIGMKEASHFLRNIGLGDNIAILDRHILKSLCKYNVIDEVPQHLNNKLYLEIEQKMIQYTHEIDVPLFALDFVFWAKTHNGVIFK